MIEFNGFFILAIFIVGHSKTVPEVKFIGVQLDRFLTPNYCTIQDIRLFFIVKSSSHLPAKRCLINLLILFHFLFNLFIRPFQRHVNICQVIMRRSIVRAYLYCLVVPCSGISVILDQLVVHTDVVVWAVV